MELGLIFRLPKNLKRKYLSVLKKGLCPLILSMKKKDKIILDLCGGTGSWSRPYKRAGYDVRLITLPDFNVLNWRHYPEIMEPLSAGNVYGILAAPPCTQFSMARNGCKTPRDFKDAMRVVRACMEIIWIARANGQLKFWALENPTGYLRQFLGVPPMWFYQWEFGTKFYKRTDIWGYFNEPARAVKKRPDYDAQQSARKWDNPKIPAYLKHLPSYQARAAWRAITPSKFARAFYKSNP